MKHFLWLIGMLGFFVADMKATTTSGSTLRNVNTSDGIVLSNGAAGSNGSGWETDEVLEGGNLVNWFLTWDDTNVYIGRIGGDNTIGSAFYLSASYPGAVFANRGFNFDQLEPELSGMGGCNFVGFCSTSNAEFRSYNGGWSAAGSLTPQFSTQGTIDHFEVAIPWSAVTGGNGKPMNLRLVLYQIEPGQPTCVQEFVVAESPWGTGNPGDGPSVAVNDGIPLSQLQPTGCDVGDSAATRWWGCYPIVGDLGPNNWAPTAPDAGADTTICISASAFFLRGNAPSGQTIGTWSVVAQPPGSPAVTINNPNDTIALAQNLAGLGTYTFVWTFNNGGCSPMADTLLITRIVFAATAAAMGDTVVLCSDTIAFLRANGPGNGQGLWSLLTGSGTILTPNDSVTTVTGLGAGNNVFQYTISNGFCPATLADVAVYMPIPVFSDAGPDLEVCAATSVVMAGNEPDSLQPSAQGFWTMVSGPSAAYFVDPYLATTNVTFLVPGNYQMAWIMSNYSCPVVTDLMQIVNYESPIADAGGDQIHCLGEFAVLEGNDFSSLGNSATYQWSQLSGPSTANFSDTLLFNATVLNLLAGQYHFQWSVQNGICPLHSDEVMITVVDLQPNGIANEVLPDSGETNGSILVADPINGNSPFMYSIDNIDFGANASFTNLGTGVYTFYIVDANGCSDSLTHSLAYIPPNDTVAIQDTIKVPTGFSPNGDGVNDTWEIPGIEHFPNAVIEVFNSWGGMVYRSVGFYAPWNGQRNGQDLPTAVYYFVIDVRVDGQRPRQGSLTILR